MRIAYLVNRYPTVSHSFIRREILALERRGVEVMRIALREWRPELLDAENQLERERTRYVLREGATALLIAVARMLLTRPMRLLQALALALRMGHRGDRPLPVHLIYLAEACRIEPWLRAAGVQHLHAHFGTNSAEVAMLVHALGGPQWSFTIHGPKEYDNVQPIGLAEKIRRCAFVVAISSYGRSQLYRLVEHQHWPKVKVVHCGLEAAYFAAAVSPAPAARRLVCVGRLCEQKGQLLLVEAAHRLAAQGIAFELVLAGDGELRSEIEALIRRHKLQDRVRITGWISGDRGARANSGRTGTRAAKLCRGPSDCHHGGHGPEAAGHQHIRGRHSGTGATWRTRLAGASRRRRSIGGRHAGLSRDAWRDARSHGRGRAQACGRAPQRGYGGS